MFDPYHKWLGISDAQRPPNHYRLLGLELFESDLEVIQSAADRQMAHLRQFQSGEHGELSQELLNEMAQARVCLSQGNSKANYDKQLRSTLTQMQPPVVNSPITAPSRALPTIDAVPQDLRSRSKKSSWFPMLLFVATAVAVLGALIFLRPWELAPVDLEDGGGAISEAKQTAEPLLRNDIGKPSSHDEPSSNGLPKEKIPKVVVEATASGASPTEAGNDEQVVTSSDSESPQPRLIPPWRQAVVRVAAPPIPDSHPFAATLSALKERDIVTAKRQLASIEKRSTLNPRQRDAASRMRLLIDQVASFWNAVDAGLEQLAVNDKFTLRDTLVTVSDSGPGQMTLRCSEEEKTFVTRHSQIDTDLAIALYKFGAEAVGPAQDWMMGSFLSIDKQGDFEVARQLLDRARGSGAATELLGYLSDSGSADQGSPVAPPVSPPSKREIEQAKRKMHQEFETLLAAKTPQQKQGAANLLDAAAATKEDASFRYVLMTQSVTMAASSGDFDRAWELVDQLRESFTIDRDEIRFETLVELASQSDQDPSRLLFLAMDEAKLAVASNEFGAASRFLSLASGIARRHQNRQFSRYINQQQANLKIYKREFASLAQAFDALEKDKDDADANLAIGRFVCLTKGDFEQGLPYLLKSEDQSLLEMARLELSETKPKAIADGWWEISRNVSGIQAANVRKRAATYYSAALSDPSELEHQRIRANLKAVAKQDGNVLFDLQLAQLVAKAWRVEWSNGGLWESLKFNSDGFVDVKANALPWERASWKMTMSGVDIFGSDNISVYRLFPESDKSFRCEKFRLPDGESQCKGKGTLIVPKDEINQ